MVHARRYTFTTRATYPLPRYFSANVGLDLDFAKFSHRKRLNK